MIYSLKEKQILWIVGSIERLGWLGYFSEIGYKVNSDAIDLYYELDEIRDCLYENDLQVLEILSVLLEESNMTYDDMKAVYDLIMNYKNHRNDVFCHAMRHLIHS